MSEAGGTPPPPGQGAPATPPEGAAAAHAPHAAPDLDATEAQGRFRMLFRSRLFWLGLGLKALASVFLGSHFATRWFAPFFYAFVHGRFADPWTPFFARGENLAFPYGPGMLVIGSISWLPALFTSFDPSGHLGLFLLRVPLLAADATICFMLVLWLRMQLRDVLITYWLSPIVFYATYVHGQLDLIPTAVVCVALYLLFEKRIVLAGLTFGLAVATKAHLLIALPFALTYLYRLPQRRLDWLRCSAVVALSALALYALPLRIPAFRTMVFGSAEAQRIWSVVIPYDRFGLVLYVAPAGLLIAFVRFLSYRKISRDLTLMFLGILYVALVALVPPQPGWFVWSIPFVAILAARSGRSGRMILSVLSPTYLLYFFVGNPGLFAESLDPTFGPGTGEVLAASLVRAAPRLFGAHASSVAWTLLFSITSLAAYEMYRFGVRSNAIYPFRDQSFMLGIAGDSGAGKHTLGADLAGLLGSQLSLVDGDDDHKWERGHEMWQRFTHLDPRGNRLRVQRDNLATLRDGGEIRKRRYDHSNGRFTPLERVTSNDFICVMGLHTLYLASQRSLFHLKVFVDPEEGVRREWKIARDVEKRRYTRERAQLQLAERHEDSQRLIHPQMEHADVVVRHGRPPDPSATVVALQLELSRQMDPDVLIDALGQMPGLEIDWQPAVSSAREKITIAGQIAAPELRAVAAELIPSVDELVQTDGWLDGGRGVAQFVLLHSIGVMLRARPA